MLKTLLKAVGLLACVAWFNLACAANMGGINVASALGHPLKAEISLSELGKTDKSGLVAKLASVNDFKGAGIDFPYSLPKLTFEIATRANGEAYIKLTSTQPVNEPFVSLLIELSWPTGKLLREYTFLLDPAGFVPEQPKMAEVKPVEPMLPSAEPVVDVIPLPAVVPEVAVTPAEVEAVPMPAVAGADKEAEVPVAKADMEAVPVQAEMAPAEQMLAEPGKVEPVEEVNVEPLAPAQQAAEVSGSILVERGDTLGRIADEVKPVDVSLERMLVAMYRANAKTFDGRNMNRIRAGKILRMPEAGEIEKVTQAAAVKEIRAQVADWHAYRQKLAAAQTATPEQAPKQEVAGKINAAVAEKAPPVKESAKEVLRLSKGESLGDKAVTGSAAKSKQAAADDDVAKSKQLLEEQKKLAKLEAIQKDASKLVELKGAPVATPAAPEAAPAPVAEPKPVAKAPVEAPAPAAEEFDIMAMFDQYLSMLLDDPVLLGGGVAVLLLLGGLGFYVSRRGSGGGQKKRKKNEEVGEVTGSWRTPVAPSPDTGDFTVAAAETHAAPMSVAAAMDDVDPISEADLFLNFGRDAQAEEILKDALTKTPSNVQIKLKLLSIYANRKDSKSFSRYAQEIKDSGDTSAWERAAVMGREIDPSNPNYGGAKGEARQREPAKAEVDFDLGAGKASTEAISPASKDFNMDFDLTASQSTVLSKPLDLSTPFASASGSQKAKSAADVDATSILSREVVRSVEAAPPPQASSPMDFDVSGILPGDVKEIANSTTMDFDLSGSNLEFPASKGSAQPSMMDFDLSGSNLETTAVLKEPVATSADSSSALNFNDLMFEIPTSNKEAEKEQPKADKDEGMAFTIDFPTSGNIEAPSGKSPAAGKIDIDFGDININMETDTPPVHAGGEGKDEQWHEVATKLDLAKAYQEMGDADGAREILEEVMRDGDMTQRESAEKLMQQIAA